MISAASHLTTNRTWTFRLPAWINAGVPTLQDTHATGDRGTAPAPRRAAAVALTAILLAAFIGQFDASVIVLAVPALRDELGATHGQAQFVLAGYTAAYAAGLVTGGRLGDLLGRRRVFQLGVTAFTLLSLTCALSPGPGALIAARTGQGLAAALMLPQVLAIVHATFPPRERARAVGLYGATIGMAWIAGPLAGGALLSWNPFDLGWRALFLINLPVGLVVALGARYAVTESHGDRQRLDLAGAVLLAGALYGLLLPASAAEGGDWPSWAPLAAAGGAVLLVAFWLLQRRLEARELAPLLPPRLLRQRRVARGLVTVLAFYGGNMGFFTLVAYHVQDGLGRTPLVAGLVFSPLAAGFALGSVGSKRPHARYGHRLLVAGALLMAVSLAAVLAVVALAPEESQLWWLPLPLALSGLGEGVVAAPLIATVLGGVPARDSGAASGVLLTATQVAHAGSVTVIGGLFVTVLGETHGGASEFASYARATSTGCAVVLVLALLTALAARRLGPEPRSAGGG